MIIRNGNDKAAVIETLFNIGLEDKVISRPNTEWVFICVTNVTFFIFKMSGVPIGAATELPEHLINNRGLISLTGCRGKRYDDDKCFFRCLALHQGAQRSNVESHANGLLKKYC